MLQAKYGRAKCQQDRLLLLSSMFFGQFSAPSNRQSRQFLGNPWARLTGVFRDQPAMNQPCVTKEGE